MTTIDAEDREELIDRLQEFPARLQARIETVEDEEALKRAGPGGGWGGVEILCHLRDLEALFLERLELMLEEDNPNIDVVEDSLWPIQRDYLSQDPFEAFEEFTDLRRQSVEILLDTDVAGWARTGRHPVFGQITIRDFAERINERDLDHEKQLIAALNQSE
ncbi:MAG: DinB family protein [Chloroflexota bacterium]